MNEMQELRDDEMFDRYEEELQKQIDEEEKQVKNCEADNYGKCGGYLSEHIVVWHVRPRSKDLARGYAAYDTTLTVGICAEHFKRITFQHYGCLPELYGWDKWDALDGLTCRLDYTGFNPTYCKQCGCREKTTVSETGACTKTCKNLTEIGADWDHCNCNELVKCVCAEFNNNELHWAILTYGNGFKFEYDCDACVRPCWRDSHENYKSGLANEEEIIAIAKKDPRLIYQKNAHGKTPFQLISQLTDLLLEEREDEYVKSAQFSWAGSNVRDLENIQKNLIMILDEYTN